MLQQSTNLVMPPFCHSLYWIERRLWLHNDQPKLARRISTEFLVRTWSPAPRWSFSTLWKKASTGLGLKFTHGYGTVVISKVDTSKCFNTDSVLEGGWVKSGSQKRCLHGQTNESFYQKPLEPLFYLRRRVIASLLLMVRSTWAKKV